MQPEFKSPVASIIFLFIRREILSVLLHPLTIDKAVVTCKYQWASGAIVRRFGSEVILRLELPRWTVLYLCPPEITHTWFWLGNQERNHVIKVQDFAGC